MGYQKIINSLDDTPNQLSKFRTKNWTEINDQSRRVHNVNSDIILKTTILRSILCNYSDVYILVNEKITITGVGTGAGERQADEGNKGVIFRKCIHLIIVKMK